MIFIYLNKLFHISQIEVKLRDFIQRRRGWAVLLAEFRIKRLKQKRILFRFVVHFNGSFRAIARKFPMKRLLALRDLFLGLEVFKRKGTLAFYSPRGHPIITIPKLDMI